MSTSWSSASLEVWDDLQQTVIDSAVSLWRQQLRMCVCACEHRDDILSTCYDWLSMVLRVRQHNIGYTADGFYRSDDPTNSDKALKEGG